MTDKISISLYELAYATHLYGAMTGFDKVLVEARVALHPAADLEKPQHRDATLDFLRRWGCRLASAEHKQSSNALLCWWRSHATDLPKPGQSLEALGKDELAAVARAYASLAGKIASSHARFGPVAAAKTLFLLRPQSCPPWDNAIRKYLNCEDSAAGYERYLEEVAGLVKALAAEARVPTCELPRLVGRPGSSPAEVVDEYLWVRCSRGMRWEPPTPKVLGRWATWARHQRS